MGLGTAGSYAVLAATAVTNTGPSTLNGDLGVTPSAAVTGFPPGIVHGTIHAADAVAAQAQADLTTAYDDAAGRTPPTAVPADLVGLTLTPGVFRGPPGLGLSGALTLDARGDPSAVFVVQAPSTLVTAAASHVNLVNGAQACNVFWQVGSSATLGTSSTFVGNILAHTSISLNDSVTVYGRALARNGAVTLINDTITAVRCAAPGGAPSASGGTSGTGGGSSPGAPAPGGSTRPTGGGAGGTPGTDDTTSSVGGGTTGGSASISTVVPSVFRFVQRFGLARCVRRTFRVVVSGRHIRGVTFTYDGRVVARRTRGPFQLVLERAGGVRRVGAHVLFGDGTPPATLTWRYRACGAASAGGGSGSGLSRPPIGRGGFTG